MFRQEGNQLKNFYQKIKSIRWLSNFTFASLIDCLISWYFTQLCSFVVWNLPSYLFIIVLSFSFTSGRFQQKFCFKGHQKYVSAVCWAPASHQFPQGLILTGSHDKMVHVYNPLSPTPSLPIYTLSGHKDAGNQVKTMLLFWECCEF